MTFLKASSILFALLYRLVIISILYESRFSKKKTLIFIICAMLPLTLINFYIFVMYSAKIYMTLLILTLTLPSFIFFNFTAKHRNGRLLFTLCFVDTIFLEIIHITNILEYYIPGDTYIFMFTSRFIIFSVLTLIAYKKLRPTYLNLQKSITKGWYSFAVTALIFYFVISLAMVYPTPITTRPEYLPVLILLFILMPVVYFNIFTTLHHQQQIHKDAQQKNILKLQVSGMTKRIDAFNTADEKFRIERHNFRHKMQAIASLIENKQYKELEALIPEYINAINETRVKRYCTNAVIDAVLSSYLQKAEQKGINVSTKIIFPDTITVNEVELATVFANAIENAINACEKLTNDDKYIDVQVLSSPRFMIQISNSFNGNIEFDQNGIPTNPHEDHGFGTRSIVAFCDKSNALYEFKADGNKFSLRIVFS